MSGCSEVGDHEIYQKQFPSHPILQYRTYWLFLFHIQITDKNSQFTFKKLQLHQVFAPFMKLCCCRFLYFFSLYDIRNKAVNLILENPSLRVVKQKKHRKNLKFWPLNPCYKRSDWKNWVSERFSEAWTFKLWNKRNACCCEACRNGVKLNYYIYYGFIKIFDRKK